MLTVSLSSEDRVWSTGLLMTLQPVLSTPASNAVAMEVLLVFSLQRVDHHSLCPIPLAHMLLRHLSVKKDSQNLEQHSPADSHCQLQNSNTA